MIDELKRVLEKTVELTSLYRLWRNTLLKGVCDVL